MAGLIFHVGLHALQEGFWGPWWPKEGTYEFVPGTESFPTKETRNYYNTKGLLSNELMSSFLPGKRSNILKRPVHYDPEFTRWTFGGRKGTMKGHILSGLQPGDRLFFVISVAPALEPIEYRSFTAEELVTHQQDVKVGIFSLYTVEREPKTFSQAERENLLSRFRTNAYVKRQYDHSEDVLIAGSPAQSFLLQNLFFIGTREKSEIEFSNGFEKHFGIKSLGEEIFSVKKDDLLVREVLADYPELLERMVEKPESTE